MRNKYVTRSGIEVTCRTHRTVTITMSEDWADCVVAQAEGLLNKDPEKIDWDNRELKDLVEAIYEAIK